MAITTAVFLFTSFNLILDVDTLELTYENFDVIVFAFKAQTVLTAIFAFLFSAQFIYRELPGKTWQDKFKLVRV